MALSLGGLTFSTSLNVGGLVSTLTSAVGGLSTASVVLTQSAASSTTSAPGLLPSPVQSLLNNLTATSNSQPAVTSSSLFAGLQVQVPGLPLDVGFPFLVENITPPRVNSSLFDQYFKSLRLAWSPELVTLQNTGTDAAPSFDTSNTPLLDAGQPFTLLTALPQPGTVVSLPIAKKSTSSTSAAPSSTSGVSSAPTPTPNGFASNTLFTIPENAFITSKWDFYKSDGAAFVPVTRKDYKLLNDSLFGTASGSSQYVFYPNPDLSSVRSIVGCLNTTIFIPDGSNKNLAAPRLCLGGRISAWSSVFSIESGVIRNYPGTKGLFHIDVDTNAPLPGNPITLLVNPVDKLPLLAPRVDTIVDAAPDLKVTAAIDFGAPLNAFIGAGVKAITGLFNSGTADKVGSGVLTVAGVLDGLLTVPLAVDFKGRSVTKTLKPAADMITQNVLPLAGGLAGSLPIGSLVASIESAANNISFLLPQDVKYIQEPLQGLHGLTLNLLPDFVAAGTNDLPRRITVPVTLKPSITLPGRDQPLINEIYLGDIAITLPRVSLPQIAMLFHDPGYTSSSGDDILVPLDPALYRLASSPAQVRAVLEQLNTLMSELRNIFRGLLDVDLRNSIDNLLGTASTMLGFFARASEKGKGYIKVVNGNQPGLGYYPLGQDEDTFKGDAGLSAMLWVGLPSAYRLNIRFDNNQNLWMRGAKGSNFSAAFYSFRANSATSGVCIQSEERDGDDCRELASMGDVEGTYQDKARRLSFKSRQ